MKKVITLLVLILAVTFTACGYSEDDLASAKSEGYEAGYVSGYEAGYEDGHNDGYEEGHDDGYNALKPVQRPSTGTILDGCEYYESEISVTADGNNDYVVTLKDAVDRSYVSFYVRAGETATIGVPSEYLYVYFASGKNWYGYGKGLMFGEDTSYSKDDEYLDFVEYSWEYTLTPVYDGNFSESPSSENEFF